MATKRFFHSRFFIILLHVSVWAVIFVLPFFFERNKTKSEDLPVNEERRARFSYFPLLVLCGWFPFLYFAE